MCIRDSSNPDEQRTDFNNAAAEYFENAHKQYVTNDGTNPLAPPTVSNLMKLAPKLAELPTSKVLTAAGVDEFNGATIVATAFDAVRTGEITNDQMLADLTRIGEDIAIINNTYQSGLSSVGMGVQGKVNIRMPRVRPKEQGYFGKTISNLQTLFSPSATVLKAAAAVPALGAAVAIAGEFLTTPEYEVVDWANKVDFQSYITAYAMDTTLNGQPTGNEPESAGE